MNTNLQFQNIAWPIIIALHNWSPHQPLYTQETQSLVPPLQGIQHSWGFCFYTRRQCTYQLPLTLNFKCFDIRKFTVSDKFMLLNAKFQLVIGMKKYKIKFKIAIGPNCSVLL